MKGQDELGVKYYSMALYAEETLGLNKRKTSVAVAKHKRKIKGRFESIQERYRKQEAVRVAIGGGRSARGMFGVFAPTPINRSSAMSFQKHRS